MYSDLCEKARVLKHFIPPLSIIRMLHKCPKFSINIEGKLNWSLDCKNSVIVLCFAELPCDIQCDL